MNSATPRRLTTTVCLAVVTLVMLGCWGSQNDITQFNDQNIKRVRNCYSMFQTAHAYKGPKDEAELMEFLENSKMAEIRLKRMGMNQSTIKDIFVSERDGEPFKIRYGLNGTRNHAIVFEATGVDGKRMVALIPVLEVDETEYEMFWSGEKKGAELDVKDE